MSLHFPAVPADFCELIGRGAEGPVGEPGSRNA